MKQKLIVANWKAYLTSQREVKAYMRVFSPGYARLAVSRALPQVVFCVPYTYLPFAKSLLPRGCALGAQDVFWENRGPYTGEVTPQMLKDVGVTHVIIGHSERRRHLGETDEMVNKKVHAALTEGLAVVLCVGETVKASEADEKRSLDFVKMQLTKALEGVPRKLLKRLVLVYEPVWAISENAGIPDTPVDAARMIMFMRRIMARLYDAKIATSCRVIYGGSVSSQNAASFVREEPIDGVLVGSASTNAREFLKVITEAL